MKKTSIIAVFILMIASPATNFGQDSLKIFFTTGAGYLKPNAKLNRILKSSIALNSGIELILKKNFFLQLTLDVNTLRYNQQVKDEGSAHLLQNSNSPLLLLGLNGGKNFMIADRWVLSGYVGGGYMNIGEPRATVQPGNIIQQSLVRKGDFFGRAGSKIKFETRSKLLHTIYVDVNGWVSPIKIQNTSVNGFSVFVGTRMPM